MYSKQNSTAEEQEFLSSYNAADYPRPSVTVDNLIFSLEDSSRPELLLIKRGNHPEKGKWALPGGYINPYETALAAAARELKEETHINGLTLYPIGLFSDPGRDPRDWTMTSAYAAFADKNSLSVKADDDASDSMWFKVALAQNSETAELTLSSDSEKYKASLNCRKRGSMLGAVYDVDIICDGGLAFDHAKIIASAMLLIKERGAI